MGQGVSARSSGTVRFVSFHLSFWSRVDLSTLPSAETDFDVQVTNRLDTDRVSHYNTTHSSQRTRPACLALFSL